MKYRVIESKVPIEVEYHDFMNEAEKRGYAIYYKVQMLYGSSWITIKEFNDLNDYFAEAEAYRLKDKLYE